MVKPVKTKSPVAGILLAILISVLGMLSVYIAGNARGYDPNMAVLVRNTLLMSTFLIIYGFLRNHYRGDYRILVVVALLTGIGFVIQYRISSAINVDFQQRLVKQYSAAAEQKAFGDTLTSIVPEKDMMMDQITAERELESIEKKARELLQSESWSPSRRKPENY
jgi:hypothetical protein